MYKSIKMKNWLLPMILITCLVRLPVAAQDENTVLLYTFETGAGDTVKDLSGNGNDGKLMGPKWDDGKLGDALVFGGNGPRDFVEIPDSDSLDLEDGLTVEMWVFLNTASTAGGTGATKETTYKVGPRNHLNVEIRLTTTSNAWGSAVVIGKKALPLKTWVHLAGTYDAGSGEGKVYIDGELDNEGEIGGKIVPNNSVLWLGRGANPFLDGYMDELRVSNIARTQDEIQQLMKLGIDGVLAVSPKDKLASTWGKLKSRFVK